MMSQIERACEAIHKADGLLITAGAGMGVDSGLPDFRGSEGFWRAYPALARSGINFQEIASPTAFRRNPAQAWGFYGHRLRLYRATVPHEGFRILLEISEHLRKKAFVVTSNVDGQFQKAGFAPEKVYEVHGSIHHLQCQHGCQNEIWSAAELDPEIDEGNCEFLSAYPRCSHCGEIARPNILMFGDWAWLDHRSRMQALRLHAWSKNTDNKVIIELGAGKDIPTIRLMSEQQNGSLIRINPRDYAVPDQAISIPLGALDALRQVRQYLQERGK